MNKKEIEKKIATMGDPKSNGKWAEYVARNERDEKLKSMVKFGVENSSTPVSKAPPGSKQHKTDILNYVNKTVAENEKDPFYPSRATPEMVGALATKMERQRQMTGEMSTWDIMKKTAKTPEEKNEIREIIRKDYRKNGPKNMAQDDLRWIGKAKSQTEMIYPKIKLPSVNLNLSKRPPPEPDISIDHRIKVLADQRLKNEQRAWDYKNGRGGLAEMLRPK